MKNEEIAAMNGDPSWFQPIDAMPGQPVEFVNECMNEPWQPEPKPEPPVITKPEPEPEPEPEYIHPHALHPNVSMMKDTE